VVAVAGLDWSAGGAALLGSVVWALAAETASERKIAERTVRSFICRTSKFRFPWFGDGPGTRATAQQYPLIDILHCPGDAMAE
jgi:hypothetical protein